MGSLPGSVAGKMCGWTCGLSQRPTATSRSAVADGQFREDLFFRLNVVCITLPPLRHRTDELPALTEFFVKQYSEHYNKPIYTPAAETMRLFSAYWWPGNVRELENYVKRIVILGSDVPIQNELAEAIARRNAPPEPIPVLRGTLSPVALPQAAVPVHSESSRAARQPRRPSAGR